MAAQRPYAYATHNTQTSHLLERKKNTSNSIWKNEQNVQRNMDDIKLTSRATRTMWLRDAAIIEAQRIGINGLPLTPRTAKKLSADIDKRVMQAELIEKLNLNKSTKDVVRSITSPWKPKSRKFTYAERWNPPIPEKTVSMLSLKPLHSVSDRANLENVPLFNCCCHPRLYDYNRAMHPNMTDMNNIHVMYKFNEEGFYETLLEQVKSSQRESKKILDTLVASTINTSKTVANKFPPNQKYEAFDQNLSESACALVTEIAAEEGLPSTLDVSIISHLEDFDEASVENTSIDVHDQHKAIIHDTSLKSAGNSRLLDSRHEHDSYSISDTDFTDKDLDEIKLTTLHNYSIPSAEPFISNNDENSLLEVCSESLDCNRLERAQEMSHTCDICADCRQAEKLTENNKVVPQLLQMRHSAASAALKSISKFATINLDAVKGRLGL